MSIIVFALQHNTKQCVLPIILPLQEPILAAPGEAKIGPREPFCKSVWKVTPDTRVGEETEAEVTANARNAGEVYPFL